MYISLGRSKAVKKALLTAPPIPKKPAHRPDKSPPAIVEALFLGTLHLGFRNRNITYPIRNMPRIFLPKRGGVPREKDAPIQLPTNPEIPKPRISLQIIALRKRSTFHKFPLRCIIPTNKSTMGREKKRLNTGTIMVEDPKPVMAPVVDAIKVSRRIEIVSSIYLSYL